MPVVVLNRDRNGDEIYVDPQLVEFIHATTRARSCLAGRYGLDLLRSRRRRLRILLSGISRLGRASIWTRFAGLLLRRNHPPVSEVPGVGTFTWGTGALFCGMGASGSFS